VRFEINSEKKSGSDRSASSTDMTWLPLKDLTSTLMNSDSMTVGVTGSSSSICATAGNTEIFGIWNTRPAVGKVPFEMESIEALTLSARPLTTSRS